MEDDIKAERDAAIGRAAAAYGLNPENPEDRERLLGILARQRFPPLKILERPMEGDQIDFSPRGDVVRRIEEMKRQITRGPKLFDNALKEFDLVKLAEVCRAPDRERQARENGNKRILDVSEFFDYLDRHFIAPHAADDPELADDGYYCVDSLLFSAWSAGTFLNDMMAKKVKTRLDGKRGGKTTGAKAQAAAKKWADDALPVAQKYVVLYPNYSQDDLASHIEHMLDPRVGHGQIKSVISNWQKVGSLTKKQAKPASPVK